VTRSYDAPSPTCFGKRHSKFITSLYLFCFVFSVGAETTKYTVCLGRDIAVMATPLWPLPLVCPPQRGVPATPLLSVAKLAISRLMSSSKPHSSLQVVLFRFVNL